MRTEDQKQASRVNGAKSQGPKTEEGKARSSRNGTKHNLCGASVVLLSTENPDDYLYHFESYMRRFQPIDKVETDLVAKLIAASWRERRIDLMESSLAEVEMLRQATAIAKEFKTIDEHVRHTLAMLGAADEGE